MTGQSGSLPRKAVSPAVAEPPPALFSNCLIAGGFAFISGQHAGGPAGPVGGASMRDQAREAFRRVVALAQAADCPAQNIVKLTIFVTDMSRRQEVSEARREFFGEPFPCSTLVEIGSLAASGLLVEIEAVALLPSAAQGEGR